MIYCVIPRELEGELLERMTEYYRGNPEVEVIIDRRMSERRRGESRVGLDRRQASRRRRDLSPDLQTFGWALVRH